MKAVLTHFKLWNKGCTSRCRKSAEYSESQPPNPFIFYCFSRCVGCKLYFHASLASFLLLLFVLLPLADGLKGWWGLSQIDFCSGLRWFIEWIFLPAGKLSICQNLKDFLLICYSIPFNLLEDKRSRVCSLSALIYTCGCSVFGAAVANRGKSSSILIYNTLFWQQ